jgi:hypothetical protein
MSVRLAKVSHQGAHKQKKGLLPRRSTSFSSINTHALAVADQLRRLPIY